MEKLCIRPVHTNIMLQAVTLIHMVPVQCHVASTHCDLEHFRVQLHLPSYSQVLYRVKLLIVWSRQWHSVPPDEGTCRYNVCIITVYIYSVYYSVYLQYIVYSVHYTCTCFTTITDLMIVHCHHAIIHRMTR